MKCPFRVNEIHAIRDDGEVELLSEFGECYKKQCPYWGVVEYTVYGELDGCRKVNKEVR